MSLLVCLSGPPGSGKTTLAMHLRQALASQHRLGAVLLNPSEHSTKLTAMRIAAIALSSIELTISALALFLGCNGASSPASLADATRRAISISRYRDLVRQASVRAQADVLILDEPTWHALWSLVFHTPHAPDRQRLSNVARQLCPPHSHEGLLIVDVLTSPSLRRSRLQRRHVSKSRFGRDTLVSVLDRLETDKLYDEIRVALSLPTQVHQLCIHNDDTLQAEQLAARMADEVAHAISTRALLKGATQ